MKPLTREQILTLIHSEPEAIVQLIEALFTELQQLRERVQDLEDQLAQNSANSHKPPSSDGLKKRSRSTSLRQKTGKKRGGQEGHSGTTLRQIENPDRIQVHRVDRCAHCASSLSNTRVAKLEKRQVFDLPSRLTEVTEHQAEIKICPHCQEPTRAPFPQAVTRAAQYGARMQAAAVYLLNQQLLPYDRTAELFRDLLGQPVAVGTLANWQQRCAAKLAPHEQKNKAQLVTAEVLHVDETGMRINGELHWLHTVSTAERTFYYTHPQRGHEAMTAIGILPQFHGTVVHDFWKPYQRFACAHAFCNVHLLRELKFVAEQHQQAWAKDMSALLLATKAKVARNSSWLARATLQKVQQQYRRILQKGFRANPPPLGDPHRRGRKKQSKSRNLLERLRTHAQEILAFAHDFNIPFDNNQAERDLRMMKVQQKISGTFRNVIGARAFCRMRGFISTCRKQNFNVLDALECVLLDKPVSGLV